MNMNAHAYAHVDKQHHVLYPYDISVQVIGLMCTSIYGLNIAYMPTHNYAYDHEGKKRGYFDLSVQARIFPV